MKISVLTGHLAGKVYFVRGNEFKIGRELDNDLILDTQGISRHHCVIRGEGDCWMVEDLHSTNGIYVNGRKVDGGSELFVGDTIKVYDVEFKFCDDSAVVAMPSAASVENPRMVVSARTSIEVGATGVVNKDAVVVEEPKEEEEEEEDVESKHGNLMLKIVIACVVLGLCVFFAVYRFSPKGTPVAAEQAEVAQADAEAAPAGGNDSLLDQSAMDELNSKKVKPEKKEQKAKTTVVARTVNLFGDNNGEDAEAQEEARPAAVQVDDGRVKLVLVDSVPAGADIMVDGMNMGKTPMVLRSLAEGSHKLELSKDGYEKLVRQIEVPDVVPSKPYELMTKVGTLSVTTNPSGAWVWEGRQFLGVTPLLLSDMAEGKHELTIVGPGCESVKKSVEVTPAKGNSLDLTLKCLLGGLELVTRPAGCSVYLNGSLLGVTEAGEGGAILSAPLKLDALLPGTCVLKVEHPSGIGVTGNIVIPKGQNIEQRVSLWVPTHKITLVDNREINAFVLEQNNMGDVAVEYANKTYERILKPQISAMRELNNDEMKQIVEKLGKDKIRLQNSFGKADAAQFSAEDFSEKVRENPKEIQVTYHGKQLLLKGTKFMLGKEGGLISVRFGSNVQCLFTQGTPDSIYKSLSEQNGRESVEIRGICDSVKNGTVVLRNCTLADD